MLQSRSSYTALHTSHSLKIFVTLNNWKLLPEGNLWEEAGKNHPALLYDTINISILTVAVKHYRVSVMKQIEGGPNITHNKNPKCY